jgi:5-methylcytosine-specific restriction endonuclease McrA
MPIRPENLARYPKDWPQISQSVRSRAREKCEWCGVQNKQLGGRLPGGTWCPAAAWDHPGDRPIEGGRFACEAPDGSLAFLRIVRIVLTVAHLDHTPENCSPENLKALCQRCHNRYDAPKRRQGIQERARAARAAGDLFEGGKP